MKEFFRLLSLGLLFVFSLSLLRSEEPKTHPQRPQELWKTFDPEKEPLEIMVLKEWSAEGADWKEMIFTGITREDRKVRVYAVSSVPSGKKNVPAILHIHGGGQTAMPEWLKFWNKQGYAAMTYDWWGRTTDWAGITSGNNIIEKVLPDPTLSSWYLWTCVARRALTVLEKQPGVDPGRLGAFGVSMGGTITWLLAGTDERIKGACAIYGAGWNTYPAKTGSPDPYRNDEEIRLRRQILEPESYAALVKCPILYLSSTNDHWGKMDSAFQTLERVKPEHRQAFTPFYMHYIADRQGIDLPLWMDTWVKGDGPSWPATPRVEIGIGPAGIPELRVQPDTLDSVQKVDVYYSEGNPNPRLRHWRTAEVKNEGKKWTARLPVFNTGNILHAFANVYYASGICLSSDLQAAVPAKLGAKATLQPSNVLADFSQGLDGWTTEDHSPDPIAPNPERLALVAIPDGKFGVTAREPSRLQTFKIGDPAWHPPAGAKVEFKVLSPEAGELIVYAFFDPEFAKDKEVLAEKKVPLAGGKTPQVILLSAADFTDAQGKPLRDWNGVRGLGVRTEKTGPVYSDFQWRH